MTSDESRTADLARSFGSLGAGSLQQAFGEMDGWMGAIAAARDAVDLFPKDTKDSLHRFGAETVLRAVEKAARDRGIRFMSPTDQITGVSND